MRVYNPSYPTTQVRVVCNIQRQELNAGYPMCSNKLRPNSGKWYAEVWTSSNPR